MAAQICHICQSSEIEFDQAQGNSVCTSCGAVLEENTIVSEVTFSETAAGAPVLQGQFVSEKGSVQPPMMPGFQRRYQTSDSREFTLSQAKTRIQNLAYALNLSDHHVESAHRWFILAFQHQFTRGRRSQSVAAGCLYIVCRQEKTSHMLLDFSDILRTNVFHLGNVFLKLCRLLNLDLPLVDPSLYIGRFASRLEFGEKTGAITNTALRLVSRMRRDWIQTGRHPAGICGACLLIAARMYGFSRTQKEILYVVRVCDITLRRRLAEFSRTPSGKLTPEEFHGVWLEEEIDPPSFSRNRRDETKKETIRKGSYLYSSPIIPASQRNLLEGDLSVLDEDSEVSACILQTIERELKTKLWMEANKDYLESQEEKVADPHKEPRRSRRKREHAEIESTVAQSPAEAARQLISTRKFSKKFNYQVLDSLLESPSMDSLVKSFQPDSEI